MGGDQDVVVLSILVERWEAGIAGLFGLAGWRRERDSAAASSA
jgi:hypothetical protein